MKKKIFFFSLFRAVIYRVGVIFDKKMNSELFLEQKLFLSLPDKKQWATYKKMLKSCIRYFSPKIYNLKHFLTYNRFLDIF